MVMPMRELTAKEAAWFCRGRGIPGPVVLPALPPANLNPRDSVNQLSEGFINSMQAALPSIVFTILRTASALAPFPWNEPGAANEACGAAASASGRQVVDAGSSSGAQGGWAPVCSICSAPLTPAEVEGALAAAAAACKPAASIAEALQGSCCTSCQGQVLGSMRAAPVVVAGDVQGSSADSGLSGPVLPDYIAERLQALKTSLAAGGVL